MGETDVRYRAFISYSHRDERAAARLHRRLESFRLPRALREQSGHGRIRPVFRDRDELASSTSLGATIETALDASEALVVVCSPAAAQSRWVNQEIRYFRGRHPERPVLAFVVSGDPGQDPRRHPGTAALPLALLLLDPEREEGGLGEPLAADARRDADGFRNAFLKLAAGLLGVRYDDLRRRAARRRQRVLAAAGAASLSLALLFAWLAWRATVARDEARAARAQAELELTSERQTRNFLLSVFRLADPGEARGEAVTVREVLDAAVERIDATGFARPVVKSRFLATLGQAYASLGLNRRSLDLLSQSLESLPASDGSIASRAQRTDTRIELADVHFSMGHYDQVDRWLSDLHATPDWAFASPAQRAHEAALRGDLHAYREEDAAAGAAYRDALGFLDRAAIDADTDASLRSRALGGLALVRYFEGAYAEAEARYREVVDLLLPVFGERHPDTIWARVSLGGAAYAAGDVETAASAWEAALENAALVLGARHPEVGTIKNNLGRLRLEEGDTAGAESLLRDALSIDREHRGDRFDDLVYPLVSLALARIDQGDWSEAGDLLSEARAIAELNEHAMTGVILTNQADVACATGSPGQGLAWAERALAVNHANFGEDDWHSQRAVLVREFCASLAGRPVDDEAVRQALAAIEARWPRPNVFRQRASDQLEMF